MTLQLKRIDYERDLNDRQRENYNFQKVSAVLAEYGFMTIRLSDDWQNADFIAQHIDGETFLKVQLKGRLTFKQVYRGRSLYICFPDEQGWYLYPHDEVMDEIARRHNFQNTKSWKGKGEYNFPNVPGNLKPILTQHRL